jgi:molybdenum cofactor cytidylyltransferase
MASDAVVGAVVLAAGLSRRMGEPKMVLPWGGHTIIEQVVSELEAAGADPICVVTGGARAQVEEALRAARVHCAYNPSHADGEMLHSLRIGLENLPDDISSALVALGDQPQIRSANARAVIAAYRDCGAALVIPSYHLRRGHPWLLDRSLWPEIAAMQPPATLRDFLNGHASQIYYVTVEDASILADMDTPEDYRRERPDKSSS